MPCKLQIANFYIFSVDQRPRMDRRVGEKKKAKKETLKVGINTKSACLKLERDEAGAAYG